jgi:hypothetical protein
MPQYGVSLIVINTASGVIIYVATTLTITTLSIMTLSITTFSIIVKKLRHSA